LEDILSDFLIVFPFFIELLIVNFILSKYLIE